MEWMEKIQKFLGIWLGSLVLLFMRLFWGYLFITHGLQKLGNIEGTASFFENLGILWPTLSAWVVGIVETLGGLALLLGAFSPTAALLLAITMIVAYVTAHTEGLMALFSNPQKFVDEAPFMYLLTTLLVFSYGPGKFSIDTLLRGKKDS